MALDIRKGLHGASFPSKVASSCGQYGHIFNTVVTDDAIDNGSLCAKGDYVSFDQYEQDALEASDVVTGEILDQDANGYWYVEFKTLPDKVVLYMYNSPVSEYSERDLQVEALFYNEKNDVVQGMMLMETDVAEYSAESFTGTPAKGKAVEYDVATNKWVVQ